VIKLGGGYIGERIGKGNVPNLTPILKKSDSKEVVA
jgi:hypothetical protein